MPSARFEKSVASNIKYWLTFVAEKGDTAVHELDQEHDNILRAAQFGSALAGTWKGSVELAIQVFTLIERRGYWRRWIPILRSASRKWESKDDLERLDMLDRLGQCYRFDRQWEKAITTHEAGETVAFNLGDELGLAKAHLRLSQVYWAMREYDLCEEYGETAEAEFRTIPDPDPGLVGALTTILGLLFYGRGDHEKAIKKLNQAVDIYRGMQQPALLGRSLMNLALSLEASGNADAALPLYEDALAELNDIEYELDKIRVELSLGTLHINAGRLKEAEAAFSRANSEYLRSSGLVYYQALTANNLGNTYLEMGRFPEAEEYLRQSISLWKITGGRLMLANTIGTLAETAAAKGEDEEALLLYEEAAVITAEFMDDAWGRRLNKKFESAQKNLC